MKRKITATVLLIIMLVQLSAYADPNGWPELMDNFANNEYDKIDEFIYNDQTGIVESVSPVEVNVKDGKPLWEASRGLLGTGLGPSQLYDRFFDLSTGSPEIKDSFKEFAPSLAKNPIMRLGFGNSTNMLKLLGDYRSRSIGEVVLNSEELEIYTAVENSRNIGSDVMSVPGPLEFVEMAELVNPDMEFILILSFAYATAEDNANLVRYFMDDPKESPWGAKRAADGHPEPIPIKAVEIGNEVYTRRSYGDEEDKRQVDFYCDMFIKHADAIGKYYPNLGVSMCLMCMDGVPHEIWNEPVIERLGPYLMEHYDENNRFASLHHYYSGYEMAYTKNRIQCCIDSMNKILGEGHHIKGLFTEHSKWAEDWIAPATLGSGLATCAFLNRMYQWDELTAYYANYYCWYSPNLWSQYLVSPSDDSLVRLSVDYMYDMYMRNLGDRVFRAETVTLDDSEIADENSTRQKYTVCAFGKGKDEMKLIMANRTTNTEVDLTFNFESGNSYTLVKEEMLTAPNLYSFAYSKDTADIYKVTEKEQNIPGFKTYKMPAKSMIVLTLKCSGAIPMLEGQKADSEENGEAVFEGESKFSDIANHWAENEINLMSEEELLNGTGDGVFEPDAEISRAEFVSVIHRMYGSPESEKFMSFSDVSDSDWYASAVNSAVAQGCIKGYDDGTFGAFDNVTLSDAASIIYRIMSTGKHVSGDAEAVLSRVTFKEDLSKWEKECFASLIENKMFGKFYEGRVVDKSRSITRAEAAVLLYRLNEFMKGW